MCGGTNPSAHSRQASGTPAHGVYSNIGLLRPVHPNGYAGHGNCRKVSQEPPRTGPRGHFAEEADCCCCGKQCENSDSTQQRSVLWSKLSLILRQVEDFFFCLL